MMGELSSNIAVVIGIFMVSITINFWAFTTGIIDIKTCYICIFAFAGVFLRFYKFLAKKQ